MLPHRNAYRVMPQFTPFLRMEPATPEAIQDARLLYSTIKTTFPAAVADFEDKWEKWHEIWFNTPRSRYSSSVEANCRNVPEFEDLAILGPRIIPLVVYCTVQVGHLHHQLHRRLPVYEILALSAGNTVESRANHRLDTDLEKDRRYLVDPKDVLNFSFMQRHFDLIIELNYERNTLAQAAISAWTAHCALDPTAGSLLGDLSQQVEFAKLRDLGGGILARLMLAYANEPLASLWHQLLHKVVHGPDKPCGAGTTVSPT